MVSIASKNDDIILDFFSGSATIAHAVMQLNAEDRSNRRFILVQTKRARRTRPGTRISARSAKNGSDGLAKN